MTSQSWWWDIIRRLFASLDAAIYGLVQILYQLFAYISNLTILDKTAIGDFKIRVYMILGIVMLFKIAFSLISLLMNPDDLMDSKKGVTGIIRRIIISLVLITFVPTIFATTRNIQKIIIDDNIFGQFFFGKLEEDKANEAMANSGNMVAFHILSAFYYPSPKLEQVVKKYCVTGKKVMMIDIDSSNGLFVGNSRTVSVLEKDQEDCGKKEFTGEIEGFYYLTHRSYNIQEYLREYVNEEVGSDGSASGSGYYAMEYSWLISTIAGVVVAWMFLGYCIDTGVRAVKLAALELIAPVPIFSYIDPKKGESIFQNWVKTTISTYLSLFGRLVLIYFVIYICHLIHESGIQVIGENGDVSPLQDDSILSRFATAFIYIGLLLFAKEAPKLFSDMFGIKLEGSFGTKLAKMGMAGTAMATGLAAAKLGGGLWRRHLEKDGLRDEKMDVYKKAGVDPGDYEKLNDEQKRQVDEINEKMSWGTGLKQIGRGTWIGLSRGALAGKDGKVNLSTYRQTRARTNAIQKLREDGVSFLDETREKYHENIGVGGKYGDFGHYKDELKDLSNQRRNAQALENHFNEQLVKEFSSMIATYDLLDEADTSRYRTALGSNDIETLNNISNEITDKYMKKMLELGEDEAKAKETVLGLEKKMTNINKINKHYHNEDERGQDIEKKISDIKKKMDSVSGGSK